MCACGRHVIDEYGDHVHTCKKHTGSTKAAHETVLDAVEVLCHQAGLSTEQRNIPTVKKQNGKTGQGDLVIKGANIGGDTNLIIDVSLIHEFGGNHMADVSLNGALRHAQPDKLLDAAARTKVNRYREAYATRSGVSYAFLPCVISTSGRIHGEFLRFLYLLAHRRTNVGSSSSGPMTPARKPSSSPGASTSGTRALPSAMPLRSPWPAVPASPSTLFVAPAPAPAPTTTTPYTHLPIRWLSE